MQAVDIWVKCRQNEKFFHSIRLTKLPPTSDAYKMNDVLNLQVRRLHRCVPFQSLTPQSRYGNDVRRCAL